MNQDAASLTRSTAFAVWISTRAGSRRRNIGRGESASAKKRGEMAAERIWNIRY